jgi:pimeloyl-ACP methyl ester carboxylesterase
VVSFIIHKIKLRREDRENKPLGKLVNINNNDVHVFSKGEGGLTIVFLSGHGTNNPTLDFKPLWSVLSQSYRVVVIERPGYGWSEDSSNKKELDKMLDITRTALQKLGETPPYILVVHSMAGLEALYWTQTESSEIKAIIGIDPLVPQNQKLLPTPKMLQLTFTYIAAKLGLTRLIPEVEIYKLFPLLRSQVLTEEDKKKYIFTFYKKAFTKDMLKEVKYLAQNSLKVNVNKIDKDIPMLFFISSEQEKIVPGWEKSLKDFLRNINHKKIINFDTSHYIHHEKSEEINREIKSFMSNI